MVSSSTSNTQSRGKRAFFPRKRTLVGGRYLILKQLSEGAFGQTFLAEDTHLPGDPKCVLKQLKSQSGNRAMQTARRLFEQEADVLYILGDHPQIPQLFAHFEDQHGFYLAQEYIEGRSLSQELKNSPPFSEKEGIRLMVEILEVLKFVHQQQVIHRDIKPANLIRRQTDGKIVMIDFGAVKQVSTQFLDPTPGNTDYTIAIGTTGYIPNEQLGGRPRYSSDIYAAGMIGIQAMTGVPPSGLQEDERTGEVLWRDRVPHISSSFAKILEQMVRYDFRSRYSSAEEVLKHLQQLSQTPLTVRQEPQELQQNTPSHSFSHRPPTDLSLPPTEHQLDDGQGPLSSQGLAPSPNLDDEPAFPTDYAALLQSPWIQPEDGHPRLSHHTTPFWHRVTQIQHCLQEESLVCAARLWKQRHRFNPWYAIAALGILGTFAITQRGAWVSQQGRVFYAANNISSQEILAPANRLVKNLPQPDTSAEISQTITQQIGTYLQTAETFVEAGDNEQALDIYQKVLSLDDKNVPALTQQCLLLNQRNEPESALLACQDLLVAHPENVVALWGLGKANYDMGFYDNALDYY
ncbi:MAG: protein kinase, partial [Symploca sp. SIO2B6]|nr:protein kinase [Symploca sp. SIO2B6]